MSSFLSRLKQQLNDRENAHHGHRNKALVDRRDLIELLHRFESMDSAFGADNTSTQRHNRTHGLVMEVEASFHNQNAEETFDIVMVTLAKLREQEIKKQRENTPIPRAERWRF